MKKLEKPKVTAACKDAWTARPFLSFPKTPVPCLVLILPVLLAMLDHLTQVHSTLVDKETTADPFPFMSIVIIAVLMLIWPAVAPNTKTRPSVAFTHPLLDHRIVTPVVVFFQTLYSLFDLLACLYMLSALLLSVCIDEHSPSDPDSKLE